MGEPVVPGGRRGAPRLVPLRKKSVTFNASLIAIPDNSEGAARIMAQIAKPRNVTAVMKKLRDYHLVLEGERPFNNRSREQVLEAALTVWAQLRHAIKVGDWFDRMFVAQSKFILDIDDPARKYAQSLSASMGGEDKQTVWKPYLPVAHMAAGFRATMFKTNRGRYFSSGLSDRSVQLDQIRDLLFDDHAWVPFAVQAAEARMGLLRLAGMQSPAETRLFVQMPQESQESTPKSQN